MEEFLSAPPVILVQFRYMCDSIVGGVAKLSFFLGSHGSRWVNSSSPKCCWYYLITQRTKNA